MASKKKKKISKEDLIIFIIDSLNEGTLKETILEYGGMDVYAFCSTSTSIEIFIDNDTFKISFESKV